MLLFRTRNTFINIIPYIVRVQSGRDPDINLKSAKRIFSPWRGSSSPFLLSSWTRPPMMYCRPYLYVRCTWPDLSCAHARMHITHARLRCAGQALMIEGREKGRKGSDSGRSFGRRICDVCLAGYIIGSRTVDIHFIWRLVGILIFRALKHRFRDPFYHMFQRVSFSSRFTVFA